MTTFSITDGQGPEYDITVEFDEYTEELNRADRISYSATDKKSLLVKAKGYRVWSGHFWCAKNEVEPGGITLPILLSLFLQKYIYIKDQRENDDPFSQGDWAAVYWTGGLAIRWEQPSHATATVRFRMIERGGI